MHAQNTQLHKCAAAAQAVQQHEQQTHSKETISVTIKYTRNKTEEHTLAAAAAQAQPTRRRCR